MKKEREKVKTVTGHMQNRSVADYLFTSGGSLLLPILIKFIPKLLSAFNENLDIE
jgi:hypothetical protein